MALYTNLVLYLDGILLCENTSINYNLVSDDQEVMTVVQGFTGLSPSPDLVRISADNVIPTAGEDYDFEGAKLNRTEVEVMLQQVGGTKKMKTSGYITSVSRTAGVGQTSSISFEMVCNPAKFE